jgi:hypothetical protein
VFVLTRVCSVQCDQKGSEQRHSLAKFIVEGKCPYIHAGLPILQTTFAPVLSFFSLTKFGMHGMLRAAMRVVQLEPSPWVQGIFGRKIKYVETPVLLSLQFLVNAYLYYHYHHHHHHHHRQLYSPGWALASS